MKSKHYPYFKEENTCSNRGEPIYFAKHERLWMHDWDRWEGDNGYYCHNNSLNMTATPKRKTATK